MVTILIVRHGYSQFNKENRFTGQQDVGLDEIGISQACSATRYIAEQYTVDRIYSSDLCRAYDTAKPLAERLGLPITTDAGLRERFLGTWEGHRIKDIAEKYPETFAAYKENFALATPDGGEPYPAMIERVLSTFQKIAAENEGKTVVVATHGGVVRCLQGALSGLEPAEYRTVPATPNASLTIVAFADGNGRVVEAGLNHFLEEKTTEIGVAVV